MDSPEDDIEDVEVKGEESPVDPRKTLPVGAPGNARGGRKAGIPNGHTREIRTFMANLLAKNFDNIERWIEETANGTPTRVIPPDPDNNEPGGIVQGTAPNPAKALELILKAAEFVTPKAKEPLTLDPNENPAMRPILNVTIGGKPLDLTRES